MWKWQRGFLCGVLFTAMLACEVSAASAVPGVNYTEGHTTAVDDTCTVLCTRTEETEQTSRMFTVEAVGLTPHEQYVLLLVRIEDRESPQTYTINENTVLYIKQAAADQSGTVRFAGIVPNRGENSVVLLSGCQDTAPKILGTVVGRDSEKVDFYDVNETDWFANAVYYTAENQILHGTGDSSFSPHLELTRAQVYQTLYNIYVSDHEEEAPTQTVDVAENLKWVSRAINWAAEKGLFNGTEYTSDPIITRSETARLVADYCISVAGRDLKPSDGESVSKRASDAPDFQDVPDEDKDAVSFCFDAGIMVGNQSGALMPGKGLTRAEWAQIMMNMGLSERFV